MRRNDKPKLLYKYEAINKYSLRNLKNAQLFFNAPISFNDPFDCSIVKESVFYSNEDIVKLFNHYFDSGNLPRQYPIAHSIKDVPSDFIKQTNKGISLSISKRHEHCLYHVGCTCFSETNKHILMWSHYANGHRGICLEFDTSCDLFDKVYKVSYSDKYPTMNPIELVLTKDPDWIDREALKPLLTKYKCWEYEKEWRAFHKEPKTLYTYPVDALKAIYFGVAVDTTDIEVVCLILLGQNENIRFYRGIISKTKYEIDFSEFTYTSYKDKI